MANNYIIIREDLLLDPLSIRSEGVLIGRLTQCELSLNHPSVSRAQAGIKFIDSSYYIFNLRSANPVIVNGRAISGNEALASGDELEIGPFKIDVDIAEENLILKVSLRIGMKAAAADVSDADVLTTRLSDELKKQAAKPRAAPIVATKALDIFWDKRIREAGKMIKPSPLFPRSQRRSGKAQFNWRATTDLASRWPGSFFVWATVLVVLLALAAIYFYMDAFSPAPLALAHTKSELNVLPPVAVKANGDTCTNCHSLSGSMESRCASCHHTETFVATVIEPHAAAGIGCVTCHAEHRGVNFSATEAALTSCVACHNNENRSTFNGRTVATPHGGTFGYPVVDGRWKWKGLNESDWALKEIAIKRLAADSDEQWRSKQFHALHVHRVKSTEGLKANAKGELSCSSCHASFNPIDRETPRTTCASCHNGKVAPGTNRVLIASNKPNCTSCHVQHVRDKRHWNPQLLAKVR